MNKYKIKTLQTRGSNHDLRTEDDFMIYEDEKYIICSVFDGCSSGYRSDISSYKHKEFLLEAIDESLIYEYDNFDAIIRYVINKKIRINFEDIIEELISRLFHKLSEMNYKDNEEMLSTILLLVINKETDEYEIAFFGDGVSFVNGEYTNVHDPNGDTVWYLSTVKANEFRKYYSQSTKLKGQGIENICISTDGIDTFKNKYGQLVDARNYFCDNTQFVNLDNQLKRLYNVFTKGLNNEEKMSCINQDDFTIIKIEKI